MTGYQEILTDPSYAGQIVTFTFPHIGNVGTNDEDIETVNMAALSGIRGVVLRADITNPSNYRAAEKLDAWLKKRNIIGIAGIDTRALTAPHPRKRHAERRHRPCARRLLPRALDGRRTQELPRARRPRSRQGSHHCPDLPLGPDRLGTRPRATARSRTPSSTSSPSTTAPSATSCASSPIRARASPSCRRRRPPRTCCRTTPTASSCPTAPAIRPRPASTPCRPSRR